MCFCEAHLTRAPRKMRTFHTTPSCDHHRTFSFFCVPVAFRFVVSFIYGDCQPCLQTRKTPRLAASCVRACSFHQNFAHSNCLSSCLWVGKFSHMTGCMSFSSPPPAWKCAYLTLVFTFSTILVRHHALRVHICINMSHNHMFFSSPSTVVSILFVLFNLVDATRMARMARLIYFLSRCRKKQQRFLASGGSVRTAHRTARIYHKQHTRNCSRRVHVAQDDRGILLNAVCVFLKKSFHLVLVSPHFA